MINDFPHNTKDVSIFLGGHSNFKNKARSNIGKKNSKNISADLLRPCIKAIYTVPIPIVKKWKTIWAIFKPLKHCLKAHVDLF